MLTLGWACYYLPPGLSCCPLYLSIGSFGVHWSISRSPDPPPVRATAGPTGGKDVVAFSHVFPRRGRSGSASETAAATLLTEHCCVAKQGQGFIEDQRWVGREWQEGCSMISNESGWQRSRSSTVPSLRFSWSFGSIIRASETTEEEHLIGR